MIENPHPRKRNHWPLAIVLAFLSFCSFMIAFAVYSHKDPIQLVTEDYYAMGQSHQSTINARRANLSREALAGISYLPSHQAVEVEVPAWSTGSIKGDVYFYRPNDSELDFRIPLTMDKTNKQRINAQSFQKGLWRVIVTWTENGQTYLHEDKLHIP